MALDLVSATEPLYLHTPTIGYSYGVYGKRSADAEPSYGIGYGIGYRARLGGYLHTPTIGYGYGVYGKRSADASYGYGYLGVAGSHQVVSRPYSQYQVSQQHPY